MNPKPFLPLGILLVCTGCTMAPKFSRPPSTVPETWAKGDKSGGPAAADLPWREVFTDPGMRGVIELALGNNLDLRVAALNVDKAQAAYRIQRGELLPSVGVMGTSQNYRTPERMRDDGQAKITRQNSVNVGISSWEIDFFGRLRSLKDQALNQYLATEQATVATRISMVSSIAAAYLQYAADAENLSLAQSTMEAQKATYELMAKSRELGFTSELTLKQAQSQVDAARSDVARYRGLLAVDKNALDLLAGTIVPANLLPKSIDSVQQVKDVSAGLPSEVLLRRPDILMAEYQLKAANANIGAARAAFFPNVSLTAGIGSMSPDLANLFHAGTRAWTFTPSIVAPIFAGGSLRANLNMAKASRDIALAQYQKSIQVGFREVADGLALREALVEQVNAQRSLVEALDTAHKLSVARYQEGMDGYLAVLVAQRALYGAQQGFVATRTAQQANQITLYKTLGGRL